MYDKIAYIVAVAALLGVLGYAQFYGQPLSNAAAYLCGFAAGQTDIIKMIHTHTEQPELKGCVPYRKNADAW